MLTHRVTTTTTKAGRTVYTLHDDASGASASVLPSYGFNLFDLRLPVAGQVRRVVDAAPDFAENPKSPARNGVPVLFPFPNRIDHGKYSFGGKSYATPANSGAHAIHGFALDATWEVVGHKSDAGAAEITGRYQISVQSPEKRAFWPTDGVLEIRYALSGKALTMTVTVSNPTAESLPYGFGIHPYFRCPFTEGGDPQKTSVVIPASKFWPLEGFIPTGATTPVDARLDFRKGQPIAGLKLDDVLTGLEFEGGKCVCRLVDTALGGEFRLVVDKAVRELVLYTPPNVSGVIAIEPYTQTTDAINLKTKGVDGGLRTLGHGGSDTFTLVMETSG